MIVAAIALNDVRLREQLVAFVPDRHNGINQRVKRGDIVTVCAGEYYRERDTIRFGDEVVL